MSDTCYQKGTKSLSSPVCYLKTRDQIIQDLQVCACVKIGRWY